jgi:dipeptidyl aminopeptidase/acylaminoacyl peptidase
MTGPHYLPDSRRLVLLAEQTGFRHLYVLDPVYESFEPLTHGPFEVYPLALSQDRKWYFVAATKEDPACRDVYRVSLLDGTMQRLSRTRGAYGNIVDAGYTALVGNIAVSPDARTVLANFTAFGTPEQLVKIDTATGLQEVLADPHPAAHKLLAGVRPEFFTYQNRQGHEIHGYLFKPAGWKPTDKRPLLIYVYGGPLGIRKTVSEGEQAAGAYSFAYYMAQKHGYVTCVIDPRGSSGYGSVFEKANYERPGRPQVDDLVDGVHFLVQNHGVDPKRVGIHGWSFGGFQTQLCMYLAPDVFAVGIAGAGPTEWQNYNAWYSTGTIGSSRTGKPDLEKFSLLPLAKNLKGRLLLVHGMEDPNVLFNDTVRVYRALLQAGKETQVDLFLDPTGSHGLGGDVTTLARYRKFEDYLVRNLGAGLTPQSPAAPAVKKAA